MIENQSNCDSILLAKTRILCTFRAETPEQGDGDNFVYCDPSYTQADTRKHFNFTPAEHRRMIGLLRKRKHCRLSYDLSKATLDYLSVNEAYRTTTGEVCQSHNSLNSLGEQGQRRD